MAYYNIPYTNKILKNTVHFFMDSKDKISIKNYICRKTYTNFINFCES